MRINTIATHPPTISKDDTTEMTSTFDLFRLNCLLNDRGANDFNGIITSLVVDLLYENRNEELSRLECYAHITKDLQINLNYELFETLIDRASFFERSPVQNDIMIRLSSKKFQEVDDRILKHSIKHHIDRFVRDRGYDATTAESILAMLHIAVYENINSFSTTNIQSIIPATLNQKFTPQQVSAFNEFLVADDHEKNTALFNVFLKAVEFAIVTSGKGVRSFSKDLFKGKVYLLDTNIIFRLLGVGGEERQKTLENLIRVCRFQGIEFQYTNETYQELRRKLEQTTLVLSRVATSRNTSVLEEVIDSGQIQYNDDFFTHYSKCRKTKGIHTPEQYEDTLLADFRVLAKKYGISPITQKFRMNSHQVETLRNKLLKKKQEMRNFSYSRTSAQVDAMNLLMVKELRGSNNHNYSDVKSFYLTTDRSLNRIVADGEETVIAETILPSQLFLLHSAISAEASDVDFKSFTNFLKRRTTEFKMSGFEILGYIGKIRQYTEAEDRIIEVLKVHSDRRFESSSKGEALRLSLTSFDEFTKTYLDEKLHQAEEGNQKHQELYDRAKEDIGKTLHKTKKLVRSLDVAVIVLIVPITALLVKLFTDKVWILAVAVAVLEVIKFGFSTKTPLLKNVWRELYLYYIKRTPYYKLTEDEEYLRLATEAFDSTKGEVWK